MKGLKIKDYPQFIQDIDARLSLFGKIKHRLWLFWLKITGKIGWTELEYKGIPIIEDEKDENTTYTITGLSKEGETTTSK